MLNRIPSKRLRHIARVHLKYAKRPRRYRQLLRTAERLCPRNIVEIGVYTGLRAVEMIEAASLDRPAGGISYNGFDLFAVMDDETLASELSKQPDPKAEVSERLGATGAQIALYEGLSQETLPNFADQRGDFQADLIFIDGGHAVETIQSDWSHASPLLASDGVILLDDYYVDCPHLTDRFGCNSLMETLDPEIWSWRLLPDIDRFVHDGRPHNVAMAEVRRRSGERDRRARRFIVSDRFSEAEHER